MIILRTSGIGSSQLAVTISPAILTVTAVVALMSLYLGPLGSAKANALLAEPRSAEGMHVLAEGRFKKQRGGDYVTYVERVDESGALSTIFVAELNRDGAGRGVTSTLARSGQIALDDATGRRYLVLENGTRYELSADSAALAESRFARYRELIPELEGGIRSQSKSEALPTSTLLDSESYEHRAVLAWRLSLPIIIPILAALAIPLSRTDARRGRYAKLGPALIAFLVYFIGLSQARSATESDGSVMNFLLVHLVFALISVLALTHEDWWRQSRRSNGDA
jgi:lipopolysaccharide export system permease protein